MTGIIVARFLQMNLLFPSTLKTHTTKARKRVVSTLINVTKLVIIKSFTYLWTCNSSFTYTILHFMTEKNLTKRLCITIFAMSFAMSGMAFDNFKVVGTQKFDAQSILEIQRMKQANLQNATLAKSYGESHVNPNTTQRVHALVKLHDGLESSVLSDRGFNTKPLCNNFCIVNLTTDSLEILAEIEDVKRISFGENKMKLMLTRANASTGVDLIHKGYINPNAQDRIENSFQPYTGKGVMIGILDDGFDPNHAMFLDENGVSRFKVIENKKNQFITDSDEISSFTTDNKYSGHATHVSGIAAGNFNGDSFQIQGVAPNADLAIEPVIAKVEELNYLVQLGEYCKEHNQRLVINLSYGNFFGPHDGSSLFLQALDEIINKYDIVACVSAGNDADQPIVQKHVFESDKEEMRAIYDLYLSENKILNYIATDNASPIDIQIAVINYTNEEIIKTYEVVKQDEVQSLEWNDGIINGSINIAKEEIHDGMSGFAIKADNLQLGSSDYRVGYIIKAQKGQKISSYTDSECPFSKGFKNWRIGLTSNGTITEQSCAKEVIAVGAYNTTVSLQLANNSTKTLTNSNYNKWGIKEGEITYYSSFGTRYDGQELPHICAPGAYLESSFNRYNRLDKRSITRSDSFQGNVYSFCAMGGTSMSSPYMAGIAALWLEANPALTHQQIREIAMQTANNDIACNEGNYFKSEGRQAGAGKVDAYAGLMYILNENEATLINTPTEKSFIIRSVSANNYEAFCAGATSLTGTLFNMEGKKVLSCYQSGNTIHINACSLSKGMYVLKVSSHYKTKQMKIIIK